MKNSRGHIRRSVALTLSMFCAALALSSAASSVLAQAQTYSLGGRVTDTNGNALAGTTMTLRGSQSSTQQSDNNGDFSFTGLAAGGNYEITPSRAAYTFNPLSASFTNLGGNFTVSFTGSTTDTNQTFIQFSAATYNFSEGDNRATIIVTRTGDASGTASVEYRTIDDPAEVPCDPTSRQPDGTLYPQGVAYARCDYATSIDTLTFAAHEQQKSFSIPLIDDAHVEGSETVRLSLSNPQGAALGATSTTTLTITDNDVAGQPNPIFSTPLFVRMHYLDFLSREPEAGEPWSAILNGCPDPFNTDPNSGSASCDRILVSSSFFGSPEFRLKGFYVFTFYRVAFSERFAEYSEIVADMRAVTGQTPADTVARRAQFPISFTGRAEFRNRYDALSNEAFVNALLDRYGVQAITTPDPAVAEAEDVTRPKIVLTRAELVNRLTSGTLTRAQVLRAIVESDEVGAAEFNRAFVAMQYYGYLRRTPEQPGYDEWLDTIGRRGESPRVMVNGFMNSPEYRLRFGQP